MTEMPTARTKAAPTTAARQPGRRGTTKSQGDRDRGGGGRVAAREGDRAELVLAEDRLVAGVGEGDLEHLGGDVGAGDDDAAAASADRAARTERDAAGGGQHQQQRQRVAEVGDQAGQRCRRRPSVGAEPADRRSRRAAGRVDPVGEQRQQDERGRAGEPGGDGRSDPLRPSANGSEAGVTAPRPLAPAAPQAGVTGLRRSANVRGRLPSAWAKRRISSRAQVVGLDDRVDDQLRGEVEDVDVGRVLLALVRRRRPRARPRPRSPGSGCRRRR